jgi:hypothetical protein
VAILRSLPADDVKWLDELPVFGMGDRIRRPLGATGRFDVAPASGGHMEDGGDLFDDDGVLNNGW